MSIGLQWLSKGTTSSSSLSQAVVDLSRDEGIISCLADGAGSSNALLILGLLSGFERTVEEEGGGGFLPNPRKLLLFETDLEPNGDFIKDEAGEDEDEALTVLLKGLRVGADIWATALLTGTKVCGWRGGKVAVEEMRSSGAGRGGGGCLCDTEDEIEEDEEEAPSDLLRRRDCLPFGVTFAAGDGAGGASFSITAALDNESRTEEDDDDEEEEEEEEEEEGLLCGIGDLCVGRTFVWLRVGVGILLARGDPFRGVEGARRGGGGG